MPLRPQALGTSSSARLRRRPARTPGTPERLRPAPGRGSSRRMQRAAAADAGRAGFDGPRRDGRPLRAVRAHL